MTILNTRTFPLPSATVFAAFAEADALAQWWGPHGFTNRIEAFDFRPGGEWRIVMRGPDGAEYANDWRFRDIAPPARLVCEHLGPMHAFALAVDLRPAAGGGTKLTWRMDLEDSPEHERLRDLISRANDENLARLAEYLAGPATAS
jgi:uncharacterized protein YndB with AHSA1/START domain